MGRRPDSEPRHEYYNSMLDLLRDPTVLDSVGEIRTTRQPLDWDEWSKINAIKRLVGKRVDESEYSESEYSESDPDQPTFLETGVAYSELFTFNSVLEPDISATISIQPIPENPQQILLLTENRNLKFDEIKYFQLVITLRCKTDSGWTAAQFSCTSTQNPRVLKHHDAALEGIQSILQGSADQPLNLKLWKESLDDNNEKKMLPIEGNQTQDENLLEEFDDSAGMESFWRTMYSVLIEAAENSGNPELAKQYEMMVSILNATENAGALIKKSTKKLSNSRLNIREIPVNIDILWGIYQILLFMRPTPVSPAHLNPPNTAVDPPGEQRYAYQRHLGKK